MLKDLKVAQIEMFTHIVGKVVILIMNRITSYNVCYTKLLRPTLGSALQLRVLEKVVPTISLASPSTGASRITSYNVCYTKLLRSCWRARAPDVGEVQQRNHHQCQRGTD